MTSSEISIVILIHVPSIWETTNRRYAFRALAETLPSHVAVVCVDRPIDAVVSPLRRPRRFWRGIWRTRDIAIAERIRVVRPRLLVHEIPAARLPAVTAVNRLLLRRQLEAVVNHHFPAARRLIQWIHHPVQRWVFDVFPKAGRVYHCYDEYTCSSDGRFHPRRWAREQRLLSEADVTFITSESLRRRREEFARRLDLIPNGIPEFFLDPPPAGDDAIDHIPGPRIGYLGNVFSLLDYSLLWELCNRRPDWQLVFVGPIEKESLVRDLRALPNAHFVGIRPHERLPAVLARFDVGLMPFVVNDFTRPLVPLKLFEYMAAGVPVVSTDLPNLQEFRGSIRLVTNTVDAFETAIAEILAADRPTLAAALRSSARRYTWPRINREYVVPVLCEVFGL